MTPPWPLPADVQPASASASGTWIMSSGQSRSRPEYVESIVPQSRTCTPSIVVTGISRDKPGLAGAQHIGRVRLEWCEELDPVQPPLPHVPSCHWNVSSNLRDVRPRLEEGTAGDDFGNVDRDVRRAVCRHDHVQRRACLARPRLHDNCTKQSDACNEPAHLTTATALLARLERRDDVFRSHHRVRRFSTRPGSPSATSAALDIDRHWLETRMGARRGDAWS